MNYQMINLDRVRMINGLRIATDQELLFYTDSGLITYKGSYSSMSAALYNVADTDKFLDLTFDEGIVYIRKDSLVSVTIHEGHLHLVVDVPKPMILTIMDITSLSESNAEEVFTFLYTQLKGQVSIFRFDYAGPDPLFQDLEVRDWPTPVPVSDQYSSFYPDQPPTADDLHHQRVAEDFDARLHGWSDNDDALPEESPLSLTILTGNVAYWKAFLDPVAHPISDEDLERIFGDDASDHLEAESLRIMLAKEFPCEPPLVTHIVEGFRVLKDAQSYQHALRFVAAQVKKRNIQKLAGVDDPLHEEWLRYINSDQYLKDLQEQVNMPENSHSYPPQEDIVGMEAIEMPYPSERAGPTDKDVQSGLQEQFTLPESTETVFDLVEKYLSQRPAAP